MLEHELFVSLLTDTEMTSLANTYGIRPKGFSNRKGTNIPIPLLKKELRETFAKGFMRKKNGKNLYDIYRDLGNKLIKLDNLPKLTGEALLEECGNRIKVPDSLLLSYLYVCDEELYHNKISEWCQKTPTGRLFSNYASSDPKEQLTKIFTPPIHSKSSISKRLHDFFAIIDLPDDIPEKITAEYIINFPGDENQSFKLLYLYLQEEENRDTPHTEQLWQTINSWVNSKEIETIREFHEIAKQDLEEMENEINKGKKDYFKLQEKSEQAKAENLQLKTRNSRVLNDLKEIKKQLVRTENEAKALQSQVKKLTDEKENMTNVIISLESKQQDLEIIFGKITMEEIKTQYLKSSYKAKLLGSILPDTDNYVIATRENLAKQIPTFIPEKCIVDTILCMNKQWCGEHLGKTLYLHRQAFGTAKHFEDTMTFARDNHLNVVEVSALDESEWLKELIRKEVD